MTPEPPSQHIDKTSVVAVAGSVVETLKAQPILLVVIILNCLMIGVSAYVLRGYENSRHEEWILMLNKCVVAVGHNSGGSTP